jgi:hypothetical protein
MVAMRVEARAWWPWAVVAVAACRFAPSELGDAPVAHDAQQIDATRADAASVDAARVDAAAIDAPAIVVADARPDAPAPAQTCFTSAGVGLRVCLATAPTTAVTLSSSTTIQTSAMGSPCAPLSGSSAAVCAIAGTTVTIATGVRIAAAGTLPLVLIATDEVDIEGTLDVSSHAGGAVGPMSGGSACAAFLALGQAGGGAGGSFGTKGGDGGDGAGPTQTGVHGIAAPAMSLALHGGCAGGTGGSTGGGVPGGAGAAGGGVAVLIAGTRITINGTLDASGAGGGGAPTGNTRAGGGGGAGGLIVLDSPQVQTAAAAQIFANGGGGGGGTSTSPAGGSGSDPTAPSTDPTGGARAGNAGSGGDGYYAAGAHAAAAGHPATNPTDGGGGGGGGGGIIYTPGSTGLTGSGAFSPGVTH